MARTEKDTYSRMRHSWLNASEITLCGYNLFTFSKFVRSTQKSDDASEG